MADDTVWPMAPDDLDWLVELSAQRRARLAPAAPLMWRPAADSRERHRPFLAALLDDESSVLAIRNRRGFLVALERGDHWLVDDADVTPDGDWETDGVGLLEYAGQMCGPLRLVVPVVETERMAAARAVGLFPVEHWWHRDLERARPAGGVPGAGGGRAHGRGRGWPAGCRPAGLRPRRPGPDGHGGLRCRSPALGRGRCGLARRDGVGRDPATGAAGPGQPARRRGLHPDDGFCGASD